MAEAVDCVVIGAGVIGLVCARRLALAGREVIVLEAADVIGAETSSRNSEVIHAGIYYPPGSLKARLCVEGKRRLYAYCAEHGVPHARTGKLIVATSEAQAEQLPALRKRGADNGVDDLELIDGAAARALEPALACVAALSSPSTGIIDTHALMLAFQGDAEDRGAMVAFLTRMVRGRVAESGSILLAVADADGAETELEAGLVVNAAGLHAQAVARTIEGLAPDTVPRRYLAKGSYFTLGGRSPFARLIYPVPDEAGLGVHVTNDLGGQARFGPDVEWVDDIDYAVDPARAARFYPAIRRYYPGLAEGALQPGYAGIRPKLVPEGAPPGDFVIQGPAEHGVPGLVNLYGIESPGITAALAIAEVVAEALAV